MKIFNLLQGANTACHIHFQIILKYKNQSSQRDEVTGYRSYEVTGEVRVTLSLKYNCIPDHPDRILIDGDPLSGNANAL